MSANLFQVDSFSDKPFSGNPAGVCLSWMLPPQTGNTPADGAAFSWDQLQQQGLDAVWMQRMAAEMNLSETAFLAPLGSGRFGLRWFTPAAEVDLCGHATLAAAHVLWECQLVPPTQPLEFETRSGTLVCRHDQDGIIMDFPSQPGQPTPADDAIAACLNELKIVDCRRNRDDWLVRVESEAQVREAVIDLPQLANSPARGLILTAAASDSKYDFVSRFFAPAVGVDEDPVTGSAHCFLAPYWAEILDRQQLVGYQASARGGVVRVTVNEPRVELMGQAITVFAASLAGPALPAG